MCERYKRHNNACHRHGNNLYRFDRRVGCCVCLVWPVYWCVVLDRNRTDAAAAAGGGWLPHLQQPFSYWLLPRTVTAQCTLHSARSLLAVHTLPACMPVCLCSVLFGRTFPCDVSLMMSLITRVFALGFRRSAAMLINVDAWIYGRRCWSCWQMNNNE